MHPSRRLFCAVVALAASPAFASGPDYSAEATLKAPPTVASPLILDGRAWRCDGLACVGKASSPPASLPAVQECRRVVQKLGPVAAYTTGGRPLSDAAVAACNA